jgi:hypothetical protein
MSTSQNSRRTQILSEAAARYAALVGEPTTGSQSLTDSQSQAVRGATTASLSLSHTVVQGKAVIRLPYHLDLKDLLAWSGVLWRYGECRSVAIDFSSTGFFTPLALLFIPHQIRHFHEQFPAVRISAIHYQHLGYPAHMGFFDCFGGVKGNPQQAPGGANYLPITVLNVSEFFRENGASNIRDAIDSESKKMAGVLTRTTDGFAFDVVQYSLREIIRNVFEHSGSKICMYCAQYWPTNNRVQIAIVDEGSGIFPSLTFNPRFKQLTERQSVHYALLPGVSGNFRDLQHTENDSIWRNSGYGLYMTSRLSRKTGEFVILSSNHIIRLFKQRKMVFPISNFRGTMIIMNFVAERGADLTADLKEYAEEGKRIARDIQGAKVIEASAASQLLSRDFSKAVSPRSTASDRRR